MLMLFKPWEMKDSISFKEDNETWTSAFQTFVSLAPQHITSIMDNMQQLHECHDARDDHSAQRKVREALLRGRSDFTGMDAYEGDADDDEVWLAAMQGNDTTEEGLDFCTSDLNDIIAQRAVDHAMAAGFYDATDGPQYNPGSSLPVEQGGDVAIDRADMAMKRLLAEKERVLQIRKGGDVPTASARTGPSVTSGPTQASSEPTLTTWNAEVENTRQKHMTRRFAGRHWNDLQEHHQWCLTLIEKYSLNEEQCLAFLLICDAEARSKADSLVSPLHLIIGGPGGTGKSQIFKAVQEFFALGSGQNRLKLTAPTGVAASNIAS
ncbi:hypothetical protein A4X13_0g7228 [Tilletia indica]|uniref:DNA helicase n=1 Tax=Tilletia indica TaxID=43049 RepID=A0A8T8SLZ6_9BASI|nr:hypothetical protein A4X13_0g7228 [Tilletia indica]